MTFPPPHFFTAHFRIGRFGKLVSIFLGLSCLLLPQHTQAGINRWTNIGPPGSRFTATTLAIDPQTSSTLYAGTARGVFKSTDSGESWVPKNDGIRDFLTIRSLAIDPTTPTTVYAGGVGGVLKTTNGGENWTVMDKSFAVGSQYPPPTVNSIVIDPMEPDILYIGSGNAGMFKSTDGGTTWSAINDGLPGPTEVGLLIINPLTSTELYALTSRGIFRTTNGGVQWASRDSLSSTAPYSKVTVTTLAIDPLTPTTLYAGTDQGAFTSLDRGMSWQSINTGLTNPHIRAFAVDAKRPTTVYLGTANGGIFKSTNAGAQWTAVVNGLPDFAPISSLVLDPQSPSTVYAVVASLHQVGNLQSSLGIYKSDNGGTTWTPHNTGLADPASISLTAVNPQTSSTLYAGGFEGLFKSQDRGKSWSPVDIGFPGSVSILALDPLRPSTVYVGIQRHVLKSTDAGTTWISISNNLPRSIFPYSLAIAPTSPTTLYIGAASRGGIFKSTDEGESWISIGPEITQSGFIRPIAIDPSNPDTLYASTQEEIFKTSDTGASWTVLDTGLSSPTGMTSFIIDPQTPTTLYASSREGVIKSVDGGLNWTRMNTGLPLSSSCSSFRSTFPPTALTPCLVIKTLAIDPCVSSTVYAGTSDGQVFKSSDGGENWVAMNTGFSRQVLTHIALSPIVQLALDPTGSIVYAAKNSGVFQFQIGP